LVIRKCNSSQFARRKFKYINNGGLCRGVGSVAVKKKKDYTEYWGRRNHNDKANKNFASTVTDFQNFPHIVTVYSVHECTRTREYRMKVNFQKALCFIARRGGGGGHIPKRNQLNHLTCWKMRAQIPISDLFHCNDIRNLLEDLQSDIFYVPCKISQDVNMDLCVQASAKTKFSSDLYIKFCLVSKQVRRQKSPATCP
jgi:hypothetical protein